MKKKIGLAKVLTFGLLLVLPFVAQARIYRNEPGGQLRLVNAQNKVVGVCPLKHTDVKADISGFVARVDVTQQFENPAKSPVEAIYTFPLPEDAAVDAMTMTVGNRRIVGRIKRKEDAQKIYQDAKAAGKTASLLDQERPNIFTQSVANILPGQKITVVISYVNVLKYDEGGYEWSFPLVVGPRYTPTGGISKPGVRGAPSTSGAASSKTEAIVKDADRITPPIAAGTRAGHEVSLAVHLDAGVPLQKIESVLHDVNLTRRSGSVADVSLRKEDRIPNRDFILKYRTAGQKLETALLTHADKAGDGYFTLIFQPPASPPQRDVAPKEMVFVIDQTGSQSGWPIAKSKEAMRLCLQRLNPRDTFQLIGFNTKIFPCFPKPVPATRVNLATALKFLAPIEGSGGTDILKSVQYALKIPDDPQRLRIVCYMTDGYIGNDMQVIDYIRKNRGRARMFPFGVGNSVNRFLINAMAREGRGAAEYVTLGMSQQEVETMWNDEDAGDDSGTRDAAKRANSMASANKAAERFYRRIANPVLLDPRVDWNSLPVADVYPSPVLDVFTSGPIVLKGRYTAAATGDITVSGILRGQRWYQTLRVSFPAVKKSGSALRSLWARERIENLQGNDWIGAQNGNPDPKIKEQIIKTALDYSLMSQYTSFVAVQEKIVNPGGAQDTADVPVELPEGVDPKGIFGEEDEADAESLIGGSVGGAAGVAGPTGPPGIVGYPSTRSAAAPTTRYRVATGGTFSGRAGDPLITIDAPADARGVVALLPGGEIKTLRFNRENRKWEARFDIPTYASEGDYVVSVIVALKNGARRIVKLSYRVDLTSPKGSGTVQLADGKSATVELRIEGDDDTARVTALLPWGERIIMNSAGGTRFAARAGVPAAWQGKAFAATFVLTDRAHNLTRVTLDMSR